MDDVEIVSFRLPKEELEELEELVEEGTYENKTEAILDSIDRYMEPRNEYLLYQAATAVLYEATQKGRQDLVDNISDHIQDEFGYTSLANLLEEE